MRSLRIVGLSALLVPWLLACELVENVTHPETLSSEASVTAEGSGDSWGPELFPDGPGGRWLYLGQERWHMLATTERTTPLNGTTAAVWEQQGGPHVVQRWFQNDARAVRDFGESAAFNPCSIPRLHFPVRVGKRWELDCGVGELVTIAHVEAVEEVACAMGVFDAVRVRYDIQRPKQTGQSVELWWFAPEVGVVQMQDGQESWILRYAEVPGK